MQKPFSPPDALAYQVRTGSCIPLATALSLIVRLFRNNTVKRTVHMQMTDWYLTC